MDKKTEELMNRTFNFGVHVLTFLSEMKYNDTLSAPKKQLSRCSTSIGANYEEAQAAESKKDFIHKIGAVCKECRESHYWIRMIKAVCKDEKMKEQFSTFEKEASELKSIFISIKLSAEGKRKNNG